MQNGIVINFVVSDEIHDAFLEHAEKWEVSRNGNIVLDINLTDSRVSDQHRLNLLSFLTLYQQQKNEKKAKG